MLSIDTNISIKIGLGALCEQKTSQCVVWDSLRSEFIGTLMLRDFLNVLFKTPLDSEALSEYPGELFLVSTRY